MIGRIFSIFFLKRLLFALIAVGLIYNPSGYSYYHWTTGSMFEGVGTPAGFGKILVGFILLSTIIFLAYATLKAPDKVVYWLILIGICGAVVMMKVLGWVSLSDPTIGTLIAEVLIAFALALGSLWGFVWFAATGTRGIANTDNVFEGSHHGH